ncbi:MFS transporter [Chloroflexota bacterium]
MKLKHVHYGWVTVVIAACVLVVLATFFYTFGIFLLPLTMEFNWDRGALSAAFSMFLLISGFLGIFGGRLSDKYGPRPVVTISGLFIGMGLLLMSQVSSLWQVYIILGLIMAIGMGSCFVPITSTIPRWFARKRGIAMGITVAGAGLGGMILPTLAQWLISSYGWQQAYVTLGLVAFIIIIPLAQFMKHSPQRMGLRPYGENGIIENKQPSASIVGGFSFKQAIKTGRFWLFDLILFCFMFAVMIIMVHIVPHAVDIGISAMTAAGILSIINGSSVIGRFFIGFIADRIGARPALAACLVALTLALIWLLFAQEIRILYVFAVVFGFAYGSIISLQPLISAELFGLGSLGIIAGSVMFCGTTGGAVGPVVAGFIFDVTGSYRLALLISVVTGALAIMLSLILLKAKGWRGGA